MKQYSLSKYYQICAEAMQLSLECDCSIVLFTIVAIDLTDIYEIPIVNLL